MARGTKAGASAPASATAAATDVLAPLTPTGAMATHRVRRDFTARGGQFSRGDLVNGSEFSRLARLVAGGYLVPLPTDPAQPQIVYLQGPPIPADAEGTGETGTEQS